VDLMVDGPDGGGPMVTVVITCYNHARFLPDAIESVRSQTFRDFELIVVDDGSTDDTAEVAARHREVRYLWQAQAGLSAARNTGLRAARGRYLTFLDADDRLLPRALQVGLEHAASHPDAAFVSGHYAVIDAVGQRVSDRRPACVTSNHYEALLRVNYIGMHATVLYRGETLEEHGGFDESLPAGEDYDLFLRVARRVPILCHPEVVAEYRWHGANMSLNSGLMLRASLGVLRRQREHVRGHARLEEAYAEGVAFWQRLFGEQLLDELGRRARAGRSWAASARLLRLALRYYPHGLFWRTTRFARRLIQEHAWLR
jgi:glycosyltransferase involved in cell wall biosynthesis